MATPKKHEGINQKTGRLKKGWKYPAGGGNPIKAGTTKAKPKAKKKPAKRKKTK